MGADLTMTEAVLRFQPAAEINRTLAGLYFTWQNTNAGDFIVGLQGFPLLSVRSEEQAVCVCEHLNDGLWAGIDKFIESHEKLMRQEFKSGCG
jgi:hypothetical protein